MARFEDAFRLALNYEGGFSDQEGDPGGKTKFGITEGTLLGAYKAGIVSNNNIELLKPIEAKAIYYANYWKPLGCQDFFEPLDLIMFDTGINCGKGSAVRCLQEGLNAMFSTVRLSVDGSYGPKTKTVYDLFMNRAIAFEQSERIIAADSMKRYLCLDYLMNRVEYYVDIAKAKVNLRQFLRGWLNRVIDLEGKAGMES